MAQENTAPEQIELDDIDTEMVDDAMDQLRAERDDMRDRFMRALADAENARKRSERDRREAEQFGGSKLARDMLPVYDNLKRALDAASEDTRAQAAALIEGLELTLRELTKVLNKHGVAEISPAVGDMFDPQLHQAMSVQENPHAEPDTVMAVMQKGYTLHGRVIRPAMVVVSK